MARPINPLLDKDMILRAALEIIDKDGLNQLSVKRLSQRLGVAVPSLYHHFRTKDAILAGVARLIMIEADDLRKWPRGDWKDVIENLSTAAWKSIMRHRNAAPLLVLYPPRHVVLSSYERNFLLLEKKGVPRRNYILIVQGVESIIIGHALLTFSSYSRNMQQFQMFDPHLYPAIAETAAASCEMTDEEIMRATIRNFLNGFEVSEMGPSAAKN